VVRVYDMIVSYRHRMADLLAGLTDEQVRQRTLCEAWTVHEVAAHLISFLRFGRTKLYLGLLTTAADLDRVNLRLTEREAARPTGEIVELLRRYADSRIAIPRAGYDPVLTDLVLHELDIRLPLGIPDTVPERQLRVALHHLATKPALGFTMNSRLRDLRLVATDTGWSHGKGRLVRGDAETLLLGMGGRRSALDLLDGDGVPVLAQRVASPPRPGAARRLGMVLDVLVHPAPAERRSRAAAG
jgi:uncharacterized protein (TIGR03083 family)